MTRRGLLGVFVGLGEACFDPVGVRHDLSKGLVLSLGEELVLAHLVGPGLVVDDHRKSQTLHDLERRVRGGGGSAA